MGLQKVQLTFEPINRDVLTYCIIKSIGHDRTHPAQLATGW